MGKFEELTNAISIIDPTSRDQMLAKYAGDCALRTSAIERASQLVADYARICQMVFGCQREALAARGFDDFDDFVSAYDRVEAERKKNAMDLFGLYGCALCERHCNSDDGCPVEETLCTQGEMFVLD